MKYLNILFFVLLLFSGYSFTETNQKINRITEDSYQITDLEKEYKFYNKPKNLIVSENILVKAMNSGGLLKVGEVEIISSIIPPYKLTIEQFIIFQDDSFIFSEKRSSAEQNFNLYLAIFLFFLLIISIIISLVDSKEKRSHPKSLTIGILTTIFLWYILEDSNENRLIIVPLISSAISLLVTRESFFFFYTYVVSRLVYIALEDFIYLDLMEKVILFLSFLVFYAIILVFDYFAIKYSTTLE